MANNPDKLPGTKNAEIVQVNPPIYLLAEQIPLQPQPGQEPVFNVHPKLGYWTEQTLAEAQAKRRDLVVVTVVDGESRP